MPASSDALLAELRERATALGFGAFGIAEAKARPELKSRLDAALAQGWHGDMAWMEETAERRASPEALWDGARSVIMLGVNYGPDTDPMETLALKDRGTISVYARNRDYHDIIKGKLKELAGLLARRTGAEVKVFVDTAPVMEKPLAEAGGHRLAGQAHRDRQPRIWLMAVSGRHLHLGRTARRCAASGKLRQLHALPRRLPDQCLPRAVPARCAALPRLPQQRAQGADPARIPRRHGQPHLWLR